VIDRFFLWLIPMGLIVLIIATLFSAWYEAGFREQCRQNGGHFYRIVPYGQLCVSDDGRIIER